MTIRKPRLFLYVSQLCLLLSVMSTARAASLISASTTLKSDSNPARAQRDADIDGSLAALLSIDVLIFEQELSKMSAWQIDGKVALEHNNDFEGLGENRYTFATEWFLENAGPGKPLHTLRAAAQLIDAESNIRDGSTLSAIATTNWQLAPVLDTTVGVRIDFRSAESDVFATNKTHFFGTVHFSPIPLLTVKTGLRYVLGEETSTASPSLDIVNAASAIVADSAFGGFDARRFAYKLDATSAIINLGANFQLKDKLSLDGDYNYIKTDAENGINYQRHLFNISIRYALTR